MAGSSSAAISTPRRWQPPKRNLVANGLDQAIELRLQSQRTQIFRGLLRADERFPPDPVQPPFHASAREAHSGSRRKWRNLGKLDPSRQLPPSTSADNITNSGAPAAS